MRNCRKRRIGVKGRGGRGRRSCISGHYGNGTYGVYAAASASQRDGIVESAGCGGCTRDRDRIGCPGGCNPSRKTSGCSDACSPCGCMRDVGQDGIDAKGWRRGGDRGSILNYRNGTYGVYAAASACQRDGIVESAGCGGCTRDRDGIRCPGCRQPGGKS